MNYKMDFHDYSKDRIIKAIKKRESCSFVVAYQLLVDEYQKSQKQTEQSHE